jgi:integrase
LPAARLFVNAKGEPWRRDMWAAEVRRAIAAHNKTTHGQGRIPPKASAYSFRHARISELLQVYGVDPLTVAAQTGTSLRMIERTYYKFIPSVMREKLSGQKARTASIKESL